MRARPSASVESIESALAGVRQLEHEGRTQRVAASGSNLHGVKDTLPPADRKQAFHVPCLNEIDQDGERHANHLFLGRAFEGLDEDGDELHLDQLLLDAG